MNIIPSREEFHKLAEKGNLIPVYSEVVADMDTPVSAYYKIIDGGNAKNSFLLESVEGGENIGRYSILGSNPQAVFIQNAGKGILHLRDNTLIEIEGKDVFERVHKVMNRFNPVEIEGLPPFVGGAVGYTAYDVISEVEPSVPEPDVDPLETPEALFMITDSLLVFDRVLHTVKVISQAFIEDYSSESIDRLYDEAVRKVEAFAARLQKPLAFPPIDLESASEDVEFDSNKTRDEFKEMVRKGKEYIVDGDIIQTVLSQRFSTPMPYSPLAVYRALRMVNPSPYMFLLDCGDFSIVGASPEVLAKCEDRKITVRPIAGTRKRGRNEEEDLKLEKELLEDPKERAEHIMLVDLGRNDVGRIAETGSVNVDELMIIERYSHVLHIVSNVRGILDSEHESDAVMRSTFPAGTLSGAPKVRAMQIISELEGEKRGPYGGTVAYYSFNGNVNSCITIRTAVLKDGKAFVQSGAGIVADSDPDTEFEETRSKARAMLKALSLARLFEYKW
jgi:anthranilate synthase component 1